MVNIKVKSCETVLPAAPTPRGNVWLSNLDLVVGRTHASTVYIYRPTGTATPQYFSMDILKEALSKVLVPFYPIAGRVGKDAHGRLQINCNGEGGELIEALTDSTIDDFGDFAPSPELCQLLPRLSCTAEDIHTYPLLLVQAWILYKNGKLLSAIDSTLKETCRQEQAIRCIHVALLCTQADAGIRPTIANVILMISSSSVAVTWSSSTMFPGALLASTSAGLSSSDDVHRSCAPLVTLLPLLLVGIFIWDAKLQF